MRAAAEAVSCKKAASETEFSRTNFKWHFTQTGIPIENSKCTKRTCTKIKTFKLLREQIQYLVIRYVSILILPKVAKLTQVRGAFLSIVCSPHDRSKQGATELAIASLNCGSPKGRQKCRKK